MSFAFDDPPDSGVIASANADGAAIRIATAATEMAARSRRLGMPWGKAAGSYLRSGHGIYFVPVAPSAARRGSAGGARGSVRRAAARRRAAQSGGPSGGSAGPPAGPSGDATGVAGVAPLGPAGLAPDATSSSRTRS